MAKAAVAVCEAVVENQQTAEDAPDSFSELSMHHPPTMRKPGEGRKIGIVGDLYRFLATGEETGGKYATFEAIVPPGGGPPPHIHSREEESFLVLEGQITFQLGDERFVGEAGTFLNMPVGSLHSFAQ